MIEDCGEGRVAKESGGDAGVVKDVQVGIVAFPESSASGKVFAVGARIVRPCCIDGVRSIDMIEMNVMWCICAIQQNHLKSSVFKQKLRGAKRT